MGGQFRVGRVDPADDLGGSVGQQAAGLGQADAPASPLDELRPGFGLESREVVADRRLRVVHLPRRCGHRPKAGDRVEHAQAGHVEHLSILSIDKHEIWHWTNAPWQGKVADMSATTIQPIGQLDQLIAGVRAATNDRPDWSTTARRVADQLRAHLPGPAILTPAQRLGSPDHAESHTLHVERDGSFSITAVVGARGR